MNAIYEEAQALISQLGFERVKALISRQSLGQNEVLRAMRFDGDVNAVQNRLATLQHTLVQYDASDPTFDHFARGFRSCLRAESEYSRTVRNWSDVGAFLELNGIGWVFQNLHPEPLPFDRGRIRTLIQQCRDHIRMTRLDAESFENEKLNVESELKLLTLIEESNSSSGYKGGYTWCFRHNNEWHSVIILCGDLSRGQRAYTLSHELGHVRHFTLRQHSPSWRILESSELFNEAIADTFAFQLLTEERHRDGINSMLEEWTFRLNDIETVVFNLESEPSTLPPASIDDLNAVISPAFSLFSTITLLGQHPSADQLQSWLESQKHPVHEIQPIIGSVFENR